MRNQNLIAPLFVVAAIIAGVALAASLAVGGDDGGRASVKFYRHESGLGADGFDIVAYFDDARATKGDPAYRETFAGAQWQFKSAENRRRFRADPEKYIPRYGGHCAYGVAQNYLVRGDPAAWSIRRGALYFNYNKNIRLAWLADADSFVARGEKNWPALNTSN